MNPAVVACQRALQDTNPRDADSVARAVEICGLYPFLDWQLQEFPKETYRWCGRGIGLWQYPSQFAPYLCEIVKQLGTVRSYAELGTAAGGTFIFTTEFLRMFAGLKKAFAVDIADMGIVSYLLDQPNPFGNILKSYMNVSPFAEFVQGDSSLFANRLRSNRETVDLLLIDAGHAYDEVKKDFHALAEFASCIVFHDIVNEKCPGVGTFWRELKSMPVYASHTIEFVQQCPSTGGSFLGIGVLFRDRSVRFRN